MEQSLFTTEELKTIIGNECDKKGNLKMDSITNIEIAETNLEEKRSGRYPWGKEEPLSEITGFPVPSFIANNNVSSDGAYARIKILKALKEELSISISGTDTTALPADLVSQYMLLVADMDVLIQKETGLVGLGV